MNDCSSAASGDLLALLLSFLEPCIVRECGSRRWDKKARELEKEEEEEEIQKVTPCRKNLRLRLSVGWLLDHGLFRPTTAG